MQIAIIFNWELSEGIKLCGRADYPLRQRYGYCAYGNNTLTYWPRQRRIFPRHCICAPLRAQYPRLERINIKGGEYVVPDLFPGCTRYTATALGGTSGPSGQLQTLRDQGRLLTAGPLPSIDSSDPGAAGFTGSAVIAEFESLSQAQAWAGNDPYVAAGVYRQVSVTPYKQVF